MSQAYVSSAPDAVKSCCAGLYASDWVRLLIGESLHPGGLVLTERLATIIALERSQRLLDVACGRGASAIHLARQIGCPVVGIEYSAESVAAANESALKAGVANQVRCEIGDAERLLLEDRSFDAMISECSLCTFPHKEAALAEFARVLKPGGRLGLSDLVRNRPLPAGLEGLAAWVACVADARSIDEYVGLLEGAGFRVDHIERHDDTLVELVEMVRTRLLLAKVATNVSAVPLSGVDWVQVRSMLQSASAAVADGSLGYALIAATAPELVDG